MTGNDDRYYLDGIEKMKSIDTAVKKGGRLKRGLPFFVLLMAIAVAVLLIRPVITDGRQEKRGSYREEDRETEAGRAADDEDRPEEEGAEEKDDETADDIPSKESASDFDHETNHVIDVDGVSFECPAAWDQTEQWLYAEKGLETTMVSYMVCDGPEYMNITSEDMMVREAEGLIKAGWISDALKEVEYYAPETMELPERRIVTMRYNAVLTYGEDDIPISCEASAFFNEKTGKVVSLQFLQSEYSRYDHFDDYHKMLESVIDSELVLPHDPEGIVNIGDLSFELPDQFDVLQNGSNGVYRHYYPSAEGSYASLIFAVTENARELSGKSDEEIVKAGASGRAQIPEDYESRDVTVSGMNGRLIGLEYNKLGGSNTTGRLLLLWSEDEEKGYFIMIVVDDEDNSGYDYFTEFERMLGL
ncbi:MAG: hypothetical protein IKI75_00020 [Lachnospiraceae bacterium]|nr:hypothetical protein [Lachnospiraceae bacterium]